MNPKSTPVYTKTVSGFGTWKLDQDKDRNRWLVKLRPIALSWKAVDFFPTADDAAAYVGGKDTTEPGWNAFPHRPEDFVLSKWDPKDVE